LEPPIAAETQQMGSLSICYHAVDPTELFRAFAWFSRYRRLNTIFERSKEHLIAFVAVAFISIFARRLRRRAFIDALLARTLALPEILTAVR
jgi:hypothetical protein